MSGPSGTESDETRSRRGLGATTGETGVSGSPLEAVAQAIWRATVPDKRLEWTDLAESGREVFRSMAAAAIAALELREERVDSYDFGSSVRLVSSWTSGSEET